MTQRQYSKSLVNELQTNSLSQVINGVQEIVKVVPGQRGKPRLDILDPHVKQIIKQKMSEGVGSKPFSLNFDRNRPENITYDLTTSEVLEKESLIEINNDHYIDTFIYQPANMIAKNPVLIYLHGGAYMTGKVEEFGKQMKYIAEQAQTTVVFPHYRLAPENPYPAAIEDVLGIINWVKENHAELGSTNPKMVLAGDSAGSGLINSCIVILKDSSIISRVIELYPAIDNDMAPYYDWQKFAVCAEDEKYVKNRVQRMLNSLTSFEENYLHHQIDPRDEIVNLFNIRNWAKIPPLTFILNQYDLITLVAEEFIKKALQHQIDVNVIKYLGCDHGTLNFFGTEPQAEDMCLEIARVLQDEGKK